MIKLKQSIGIAIVFNAAVGGGLITTAARDHSWVPSVFGVAVLVLAFLGIVFAEEAEETEKREEEG